MATIRRILLGKNIYTLLLAAILAMTTSCEDTDMGMVAGAGVDIIKAVTLSDEKVVMLAKQSAAFVDNKAKIAPAGSTYAVRLQRLVKDHSSEGEHRFNYKVYMQPEVNAFAMADGTIRINSGLMDMMDDGELRFVIGHEMGHVVHKHIKKKMLLAYSGSALRKAIASQDNLAGDISRSAIGSFTESLVNAQFSQQEEREADDYGLHFLIKKGYSKKSAVSALKKLATLGSNHSFLASHPDPEGRYKRIESQLLNGVDQEGEQRSILDKILTLLLTVWNWLVQLVSSLF